MDPENATRRGASRIVLLVTMSLLVPLGVSARTRGAIVEEVEKGSAAERAELQPGDVILSWYRGANPPANPRPARGDVESPFDLVHVEIEEAPRGPVVLQGRRRSDRFEWRLGPATWGLKLAPALSAPARIALEEAKASSDVPARALIGWQNAARRAGSERAQAWLLLSPPAKGRRPTRSTCAMTEKVEVGRRRSLLATQHLGCDVAERATHLARRGDPITPVGGASSGRSPDGEVERGRQG